MSLSPDPYQRIADVIGSHHGPEARRDQLSLYVAIGDSFTAGTGSPPGEAWPDRLASALRLRNPSLAFRNLAVEGATSAEVIDQLGEAIELEPDLVTLVCGANDVLRSTRPDVPGYARRLAATRRCGSSPPRPRTGGTSSSSARGRGPGSRTGSRGSTAPLARSPARTGSPASRWRPIRGSQSRRTSAPTACTPRRSDTSAPRADSQR